MTFLLKKNAPLHIGMLIHEKADALLKQVYRKWSPEQINDRNAYHFMEYFDKRLESIAPL